MYLLMFRKNRQCIFIVYKQFQSGEHFSESYHWVHALLKYARIIAMMDLCLILSTDSIWLQTMSYTLTMTSSSSICISAMLAVMLCHVAVSSPFSRNIQVRSLSTKPENKAKQDGTLAFKFGKMLIKSSVNIGNTPINTGTLKEIILSFSIWL